MKDTAPAPLRERDLPPSPPPADDSDHPADPGGVAQVGNVSGGNVSGGRPGPSSRSVAGLDAMNFLLADVQQGVGPYLSVFLSGSRHWGPGPVGLAIAASSTVTALCQIPAGFAIDATRHKRSLLVVAALMFGAGALLIALAEGFWAIMAAQALLGVAAAVIPPAVASVSLGLVGRRRMAARTSRNQGFNHSGAFCGAILAGALGRYETDSWIFYSVVVFAAAAALTTLLIRPAEIDHRVARGADARRDDKTDRPDRGQAAPDRPVGFGALLGRRPIIVFLGSVVLFQLGCAALLPFASQRLILDHPRIGTLTVSGCILVAQAVMAVVSWSVGQALERGVGRKPIFLAAFALLPVRALLLIGVESPAGVIAVEILDGVSGGIFAVLATVVAADLTRGTGRFNVMQGLVALGVGIGASLSNVAGGYVVQEFGYPAGFGTIAVAALCGGLVFWAMMPETCHEAME